MVDLHAQVHKAGHQITNEGNHQDMKNNVHISIIVYIYKLFHRKIKLYEIIN
jgi:hypothetical protein